MGISSTYMRNSTSVTKRQTFSHSCKNLQVYNNLSEGFVFNDFTKGWSLTVRLDVYLLSLHNEFTVCSNYIINLMTILDLSNYFLKNI